MSTTIGWVMVAIGALVGAPLRYLIDRKVQAGHDTPFPWGTFMANMVACAILGFITGAAETTSVPDWVQHLIGTGLAGTLSTYSTFSWETLRLTETGYSRTYGWTYAAFSAVAGFGTALLALTFAQAIM